VVWCGVLSHWCDIAVVAQAKCPRASAWILRVWWVVDRTEVGRRRTQGWRWPWHRVAHIQWSVWSVRSWPWGRVSGYVWLSNAAVWGVLRR